MFHRQRHGLHGLQRQAFVPKCLSIDIQKTSSATVSFDPACLRQFLSFLLIISHVQIYVNRMINLHEAVRERARPSRDTSWTWACMKLNTHGFGFILRSTSWLADSKRLVLFRMTIYCFTKSHKKVHALDLPVHVRLVLFSFLPFHRPVTAFPVNPTSSRYWAECYWKSS